LKIVRSTPGVAIAEPVIEVIARTADADEGKLLVLGLDAGSDQELHEFQFDQEQIEISNPLSLVMRPDSILVSHSFAQKHDLRDGDRLPLFTPNGLKNFTVRGFFKPVGIGETFGGQLAVMDVYAAQRAFDRGKNFDRIDLANDSNTSVDTLQRRLRERLPAGIEVMRPESRGQNLENSIAAMEIGLTITSLLALFIGCFIIFNSFSISVNQRWKEIGILRAIGVERQKICWMFLVEAAVLGLAGSLVGLIAGFLLATQASSALRNIAATFYGQLTTPQPAVIRLDHVGLALLIGMVVSVMAAWLPARAASRLEPVLALHNVEVRQRESVIGWPRIIIGTFLVAAALALIRFSTPRVGLMTQLAYSLLIQIGMIMVIPKLTEWGAHALRPVMGWVFGAEGVLATDSLIKSPRRTNATIVALMIGLSFVFSNGAFIQSQKNALMRYMNRVLNADMLVTTSEQFRSRSYHFSEAVAQRLATLPGVVRAEKFRFTSIPFRGDNVGLIANDMEAWFGRVGNVLDEGDQNKARQLMPNGDGLLIASNFASRWAVRVGDMLRLETPSGPLERPILGTFENYDSEKGTIFMDRSL
jgi:putative ABC transport system permease protein